jgi:hypothetical protein
MVGGQDFPEPLGWRGAGSECVRLVNTCEPAFRNLVRGALQRSDFANAAIASSRVAA